MHQPASPPPAQRLRDVKIAEWIARHEGMDASTHALLAAVVEGARDKELRLRLGRDEVDLRRLLLRFQSKTGSTVYDAATEVLAQIASSGAPRRSGASAPGAATQGLRLVSR